MDLSNKNDNISAIYLPVEVIMHIMSHLSVSDRMSASLVCRQWREASLWQYFVDKQVVVFRRAENKLNNLMRVLANSNRPFFHFTFQGTEIKATSIIWQRFGPIMRTLTLDSCDISEKTLVHILKCCRNLKSLNLTACRECFMSGRLLDDENDVKEITTNMKSLVELGLSANTYLSDALFNRLVSICPNLQSLCLSVCNISFHLGLYKKFYPAKNARNQASESVLTFFNILEYLKKQAPKLKHLSFESTGMDSTSLANLTSIEELKLESLVLRSCAQLTNPGLRTLANQRSLKLLDLALCNRVTDTSLLGICRNLDNLEVLNVEKCRAITNEGVSQIRYLKKLRHLNISYCDNLTGICITEGLCRQSSSCNDSPIEEDHNFEIENLNPNSQSKKDELINQDIFNKQLTVLLARGLNLDERAIECIAESFRNLRILDISHCFNAVTDKTIQKIFKNLINLTCLKINGCNKVSDAGITGMSADTRADVDLFEPLIRINKSQESGSKLRISLGSRAEEEIVRDAERKREVMKMCEETSTPLDFDIAPGYSLMRLRHLNELNLAGCNRVTDVSLKYAFKFLDLRTLNLSMCQQITHVGLHYLTKNNRTIENLELRECHNITDVGIEYIAERLYGLRKLHFKGCSQLTGRSIDALIKHCKNLKELDDSSRYFGSIPVRSLLHLLKNQPNERDQSIPPWEDVMIRSIY